MDMPTDIIIAIAAAVTAVATAFIAWSTYVSSRILKWEKEKDRRSRQPMLVLVDELDERNRDHRNLYTKNIGYGPALNIVITFLKTGPVTKHVTTNEPLPLQPLGQGDRAYAYCATVSLNTSPMINDLEFDVCIEYDDIFGNHYETSYKNRQHSINLTPQRKTPWDQVCKI